MTLMPAAEPKKKPRRTAERILDVTLELFNRFGEPNVSTTLISAELGISPGNLYYHYPAKEALVNALFRQHALALDELLNWLDSEDFILRYEINGKRYIQVLNFAKHQNPHKNEVLSEIPPPDSGRVPKKSVHAPSDSEALGLIPDSFNLIPDSLLLIAEGPPTPPPAGESMDNGFDAFWLEYPKKSGKQTAMKAWWKLKPSGQLLLEIMVGLQRYKSSEQWADPKYIHDPATWINGRRWEDEVTPGKPKNSLNLSEQKYTEGINTNDHSF